jgi:hypothetical protein
LHLLNVLLPSATARYPLYGHLAERKPSAGIIREQGDIKIDDEIVDAALAQAECEADAKPSAGIVEATSFAEMMAIHGAKETDLPGPPAECHHTLPEKPQAREDILEEHASCTSEHNLSMQDLQADCGSTDELEDSEFADCEDDFQETFQECENDFQATEELSVAFAGWHV